MTTTVYVQDVRDHRVHRRFRDEGDRALHSRGAEAPDTSGAFIVLTDGEMERVEYDRLCGDCFPQGVTLEVLG